MSKGEWLRPRDDEAGSRVTNIELFFDLVFVFAVTQLSHHLLGALTLGGAAETLLLMMAVWWVWIYTSWVTNALDPDRTPVRLLLLALMLAGLVLSTSLPHAFAESGLIFAVTYAAMQVGRSVFVTASRRGGQPERYLNMQRITLWLAFSALFWIAGGIAEGGTRIALWWLATAIEYVSPAIGFRVPGLGRSYVQDWDVEGGHMAERCSLFVLIALGESIVVTGTTFGEVAWEWDVVLAFAVAFIGSVAFWWIYFDRAVERGAARIREDEAPGRLARMAYTYLHLPIVAGVIVGAVSDDLVLAHPHEPADAATIAVGLGGPALYVAGNLLFKWTIAGRPPLSHLIGLALFACTLPFAHRLSLLEMAMAATAGLLVVAAWETIVLSRGPLPEHRDRDVA
ncbi:MAG: low temperature requirement protein A [Acetobacteraceae bacterium]|nr:low temperature requirement protein A [Acetobacteraceae bacterium]